MPEKQLQGVYKNQGFWRARVFERDTDIYLGHWAEKEEAAEAYDKAVLKLRGQDWALKHGLNNPEGVAAYDMSELADMSFEQLVETLRLKSKQKIFGNLPPELRGSLKLR
mmetsp:Transcript_35699/g.77920  ORF Transcript_35699/g.77920 Transcript_35699/m.77920 type:complete len:110 (-) Transcript_35699:330-659(-)|eukprot:CAMPEP_0118947384 /NCGR_PEP_ID=MMETSP1169-20130426/45906_1 /TAXON_ID=36882 /ORGANISM="Pyramimonas obovata, Strain CCMP722" /LENGTH=109 /DNA_ID=CAMNT_0006893583 /DNA_START=53 /DNA_END=382 /DNA_ORIENTATION=+